jgi:hypothetical protein
MPPPPVLRKKKSIAVIPEIKVEPEIVPIVI